MDYIQLPITFNKRLRYATQKPAYFCRCERYFRERCPFPRVLPRPFVASAAYLSRGAGAARAAATSAGEMFKVRCDNLLVYLLARFVPFLPRTPVSRIRRDYVTAGSPLTLHNIKALHNAAGISMLVPSALAYMANRSPLEGAWGLALVRRSAVQPSAGAPLLHGLWEVLIVIGRRVDIMWMSKAERRIKPQEPFAGELRTRLVLRRRPSRSHN